MKWKYDRQLGRMVEVYPEIADVNAPAVHGDEMLGNTQPHPCDGRVYTSKSQFRRVTTEHGCVELGNDRLKYTPPTGKPVHETIREAKEALGWRRDPKRHDEYRREMQRNLEHAENRRKYGKEN